MRKILCSGCLYGHIVRYDGKSQRLEDEIFRKWYREGRLVPVCPEVDGGLSVPRPPAEITEGKVINSEGKDVTAEYKKGAIAALETAEAEEIAFAIMKEGSPSCGSSEIYDGSFTGVKIKGQGITAALLKEAGFNVFNENQLKEADEYLEDMEASDEMAEVLYSMYL